MLELLRKDMQLYVKVLMNLRMPIKYQNKVFGKNEKVELLLPDEVMEILTKNGNIKLWNGKKFVKLNLGQFYDMMQRKEYYIIDYVEPKKEEPKVEVKPELKKEEPKVEVKPEPKKEEPKVEVKPEPKKEQKNENKQQDHNNENKKQRHNNNNNNNKQGGVK